MTAAAVVIGYIRNENGTMRKFISCDWGTSSFRLRVIDADTKAILAEVKSATGIASAYGLWKNANTDRISFYGDIILQYLNELKQQYQHSLNDATIIASGMISSAIGMFELPYAFIPFDTQSTALLTHVIRGFGNGNHNLIIVSGLRSDNDVMRGEETKLAGAVLNNSGGRQLIILPGTHAKHVIIEDGIIKDLKTFMTGEVFALLTTKSILSGSVEAAGDNAEEVFLQGVKDAAKSGFLNNIFHVRTNALFGLLSKNKNYQYLSGLLIGEELKSIDKDNFDTIILIAEGKLLSLYKEALKGIDFCGSVKFLNADVALINGQSAIFNQQ